MRVVLDTNILVSAFLSRAGIPNQVLRQAGLAYQLRISQEILEETERVLHRPHIQRRGQLTEEEMKAFLDTLRSVAMVVENLPSIRIIKDDPDDDHVLACALKAQVDYLVSGDAHLKALGSYEGIRIVSPSEFLAVLSG